MRADREQPAPSPLPLPDARQAVVLLGRGADCDIVLGDPAVSRRHAALMRFANRWYVVDRGSTNGTLINGLQVWGVAVVRPGDRITLGNQSFLLTAPTPEMAHAC